MYKYYKLIKVIENAKLDGLGHKKLFVVLGLIKNIIKCIQKSFYNIYCVQTLSEKQHIMKISLFNDSDYRKSTSFYVKW